jgi:eukaryotic-like serine/threonine-protein kinase
MTDRELPPDTVLGSYRIVRVVGVGGMGSVYEAVHAKLGRRMALKTLAPSLATNHEARERFLREAKILTQVRHPNVVNVTDFGSTDETVFLVMEFLAGETLSVASGRGAQLALAEPCTSDQRRGRATKQRVAVMRVMYA